MKRSVSRLAAAMLWRGFFFHAVHVVSDCKGRRGASVPLTFCRQFYLAIVITRHDDEYESKADAEFDLAESINPITKGVLSTLIKR